MSNSKFILKTALRDSRRNRWKLALFMSSIILGISALVAINSFNYNLVQDIDEQAASLLGADLMLSSNKELNAEQVAVFDSLPGKKSSEKELFSMAYIPKNDESQMIQIKALEGDFPFYGKLKSEPMEASETFRSSRSVLVDDGFLLQHDLQIGDSLKLGDIYFNICGRLLSSFGSIGISSAFAPSAYISQKYLEQTDLVKPGSLINYAYYAQLPDEMDVLGWEKNHKKRLRNESVRVETIEGRKENLEEAFNSLNYFLNLVALVSLLLGCIGVASSVYIYVKNKIQSIAVFRCLGMKGRDAFMIYFAQISVLGFLSVVLGTILGSAIQMLLPIVMADFLPYEVKMELSWRAIIEGIVAGTVITILFAVLPLLAIRKISPLRTLRASFEDGSESRDLASIGVQILIVLSLFLFLWRLTGDPMEGLIFTASLLVAFFILFMVSKFIIWAVRKFFPRNWNFVFRQGLSNLYRPNNQSTILLLSIGLGTAILTTLFIIQSLILSNVAGMDAGNQPNVILYGIEKDQNTELAALTEEYDLPIIQQVPIVTMNLESWNGKTKKEWFADTTANVRRWAANREARVTYRDYLESDEKLMRGEFIGSVNYPQDSVFISLDEGYAEGLNVDLGDEMIWNVQGARIKTYVSSFREIEFRSMRTRFFILFPNGVLEDAPQFEVIVTKSPSKKLTSKYRSAVVKAFPNVSVIDLGSILVSLNEILNKVSYVIKFMAAFSILTGLIVLLSSLLLSKYQRIKESVLLRTLGASSSQILKIYATEYAVLGGLSAGTGIVIALIGSWALARYQLELDYNIQFLPILMVFLLVVGITVFIGLLNSKDVIQESPLKVLRKETG